MTTSTPFDNEQYNPFAAPESLDHAKDTMGTAAERIRSELIGREASIQSIGFLYILGSILAVLLGIVVSLSASQAMAVGRPATELSMTLGIAAILLGISLGIVGFGLRHLKSWARFPVGVISGLGLIAVPIGTIINGYFLYLIFSENGNRVFSPEYQEIIQQTPHIKYRTSIITKIVLVLLLGFIGMIVLGVLLGW